MAAGKAKIKKPNIRIVMCHYLIIKKSAPPIKMELKDQYLP